MTEQINPLTKYFRQPAIYIQLPSTGQFWPDDSLDIPQNGELPVLPMTAVDEITYRTPDALFNGQAVVDVIQSCVPNIKNAWYTPSTDINSILMAIRIASYGHEMEVGSTCPNCNETGEYTMDLRTVLDSIGRPDYSSTIKRADLEFMLKPITFEQQNQINLKQYENQKTIQSITESDLTDASKMTKITEVMRVITEMTVNALTASIQAIRSPDGLVTDAIWINEYLHRCDRDSFETIKAAVIKLKEQSDAKPIAITCNSCQHQYKQRIDLEMSSFFATAS